MTVHRAPARLALPGHVGLLLALLLLAACAGEPDSPAASGTEATSVEAAVEHRGNGAATALSAGDVEAVALELGSRLDADGRVAAVQERFRPSDTVQLSLVTVGSATAAMLLVEWRDASGNVLATDQRAVAVTGPAVHSFSRAVDGGWAPGRYIVEARLGGESAGVREFEVR